MRPEPLAGRSPAAPLVLRRPAAALPEPLAAHNRAALQAHTGCVTFPQFFVGGVFHGGAADACMKWKKGELQPILKAANITTSAYDGDPFEFLPKWMSQNPLRSK